MPLLYELHPYLVQSKTKRSTEFIQKKGIECLIKVLKEVFTRLGLVLVKEYSDEELNNINVSALQLERQIYETSLLETLIKSPNVLDKEQWCERDYQRNIIKYIIKNIHQSHKIYLELATGGGKSYIIYKILSELKPDIIVIFSPRKNINKQNCGSKYLSLLNDNVDVFDCSINKNFDSFKKKCRIVNKRMLIVACPQNSNEKVYNMIQGTKNVFVWYDEAHHTIENWVNKLDNKYTKFFLEDEEIIKNRIFTSASPEKKAVEQYPQYFGELYNPIKVKELIDLKWLCPIVPRIFDLKKKILIFVIII